MLNESNLDNLPNQHKPAGLFAENFAASMQCEFVSILASTKLGSVMLQSRFGHTHICMPKDDAIAYMMGTMLADIDLGNEAEVN